MYPRVVSRIDLEINASKHVDENQFHGNKKTRGRILLAKLKRPLSLHIILGSKHT